ncbi:hypothetical protein [Salmonella enterica]|uniref:Uncharacterized protein n=3 Tax=Salmonella enterica TaxID=28901 RepID=A0A7Z1T4L4_SALET|nr:hypothetical protein [Salmonella enterica]EEJ6656885.1 hypothetical protein [Salmonella enterica subsp. enterica serovar Redlands]SQI59233.1 Uncharacterised protein [Salmonella enterica subsp. diarizonae]EAA8667737.1 hypothetical protein [Salmonella enterica]EAA9929137.1 hypothetical protein [Salmonella enterica]EAO9251863.1 hypothetical protein [Salmonella enterica]
MMKTPFLNSVACGTRRAGSWLRRGSSVSLRGMLWGVLLSMLVMLLVAIMFRDPQGDAVRQWLLVVTGLADGAVRYPGRFLAVAGRAAPVVPETAQGLRSPESPFCSVPYGNYSRPADSAV